MTEERAQRRLAAIFAADMAGYSRLMGADEEGTLARLKAMRRELLDPKIDEHRGRIVKTTGDGLLAEFSSVVDALRPRRLARDERGVKQPLWVQDQNLGRSAASRLHIGNSAHDSSKIKVRENGQ